MELLDFHGLYRRLLRGLPTRSCWIPVCSKRQKRSSGPLEVLGTKLAQHCGREVGLVGNMVLHSGFNG